jgi:hypothetical protein
MRPTVDDLRKRVGLPIAAPQRNTTEPCKTCADQNGALEFESGRVVIFCGIPRDRIRLYPMLRSVMVPEDAVMPCWRSSR